MSVDTDRPETYGDVDTTGMAGRFALWPQTFAASWAAARQIEVPDKHTDLFSVVIVGVGGSGLAGELLAGLLLHTAQIPVRVVRGYELPAFVGPDSLVLAYSHSGNTEETITAFDEAADRGAKLIVVATGGRLADLATAHRSPFVRYAAEGIASPLAAAFPALLAVARAVHILGGDLDQEVAETVRTLSDVTATMLPEVPAAQNPAKQIAQMFAGTFPVVYGVGFLEPVARWWAAEMSALAQTECHWDTPLEVNHGDAAGLAFPAVLAGQRAAVLLRSSYDHPRIVAHHTVTEAMLRDSGVAVQTVGAHGRSRLAQMLASVVLGDWAAYYLALLNGVDPMSDVAIHFKNTHMPRP